MLLHLTIKNIAVIESASVDFYDGLNVLTGETGAGKSILIDSISMLTGARSSKDLIRTGAEKAFVSGIFSPSGKVWRLLSEQGLERSEDGLLSIQREISLNGKGVCRIGGALCPLSVLKTIGGYLINIHGQQDALELYAPEKHIGLLDKWGAEEIFPALSDYRERYKEYLRLAKEAKSLKQSEEKRARELDLLEFETREIESASITPGEEDQLQQQRERMASGEKITKALQESHFLLFEQPDCAREQLAAAVQTLESVSRLDKKLEQFTASLQESLYGLDDLSFELTEYTDRLEYDPFAFDKVSDRLDVIRKMKRKYGGSEQAILNYYEKSAARLEELSRSAERAGELDAKLSQVKAEVSRKAARLHDLRLKTGQALAEKIQKELEDLNMSGCRFAVQVEKAPYHGLGGDRVEFLISPNLGEELKPLSKIASGGELSRIMLAMKSIMAGNDDASTYIFDEIDTGVSGRAAEKVAQKLRKVAEKKQTLVITHSSHIAAAGSHHFLIEKAVESGRTKTHVQLLEDSGRIEEIVRINAGSASSDAAYRQAEELLNLWQETDTNKKETDL